MEWPAKGIDTNLCSVARMSIPLASYIENDLPTGRFPFRVDAMRCTSFVPGLCRAHELQSLEAAKTERILTCL